MSRTLLLQLTNAGIRCAPDLLVPLEQTNLPAGHFRFKEHYEVYWEVRMLRYGDDGTLEVEVVDFWPDELSRFAQQKAKKQVQRLHFRPFHFQQASEHLAYYEPAAFAGLSKQKAPQPGRAPLPESGDADFEAPRPRSVTVQFTCTWNDVRFGPGRLTVRRSFPAENIHQALTLEIANPILLPEFEYVKPFFARLLGARRLRVQATLRVLGLEVVGSRCYSPEVAAIDEAVIRGVRHLTTRQLLRQPHFDPPVDKSLFTAGEVFDAVGEPNLGNAFRLDERALLSELLAGEGIRNAPQLEYLAGKLQAPDTALRFTLTPLFGFVFLVPGETMDHHIWELLNSHATYVWSFDRDRFTRAHQERRMQEIIGLVREQGRELYRRSSAPAEPDAVFSFVRHDKAGSNFVDGFPRWRARLEEKLV